MCPQQSVSQYKHDVILKSMRRRSNVIDVVWTSHFSDTLYTNCGRKKEDTFEVRITIHLSIYR